MPRSFTCFVCALVCVVTSSLYAVVIEEVPHVQQPPDFCGEACIAMYLQKLGFDESSYDVFNRGPVAPEHGRGFYTSDMVQTLREYGFKPGQVSYAIQPDRAEVQLREQFDAVHLALVQGVPSIVCMRANYAPYDSEHFRLIVGYNEDTEEVIYHEPGEPDAAYQRMALSKFLELWPLKYRSDEWRVIRMPLFYDEIKPSADKPVGFSKAHYAQRVMALKRELPEGFHLEVEPPFIVVGNDSPNRVRQHAQQIVRWFARQVEELYFVTPPPEIYTIWLFKDEETYEQYNKSLWGYTPSTPFGYFSQRNGVLVMNIALGGGTLCHEMIHAYMPVNFPACPAWFNEGMGSLYEACNRRDGVVIGMVNWRLPALQRAIRGEALQSLEALMATSDGAFYADAGVNYAHARYLCHYLQDEGLLPEFFSEYRDTAEADPTGMQALLKVTGYDSLEALDKDWRQWVLSLQWRG